MKKKLIALTMVLSMAALTACSSGAGTSQPATTAETSTATDTASSEEEKTENSAEAETTSETQDSSNTPHKIGYSMQNTDNPHFILVLNGMQEACENYGYEFTYSSCNSDPIKQISDIEDFIAQGCDAIVCHPIDSTSIEPAMKACQDAGVPFFNVDNPASNLDLVTALICSDNYSCGFVAGEALVKESGGSGKIGIIERAESQGIRDRVAGFEDAIAGTDLEIICRQSTFATTDGALPVMENFLQGYPEIEYVFCGNDPQVLGAYNACAANDRLDVKIYGVDASKNGLEMILDGKIVGEGAQYPYLIGQTAAECIHAYYEGEPFEHENRIPSVFADSSNAQELYDRYYAE